MTLDLTSLIANQSTGYETYNKELDIKNLKKITYLTASNGVFRIEKTDTALFKTVVQTYEKNIPGLLPMEPGVELLIPKIPFKYIHMALDFYRDVNEQDKTEASLLFFWNKDNKPLPKKYSDGEEIKGLLVDGQLIVYVPKQKNSSTLSEFHMDPMVDYLRTNYSILAETHSHNTMNAFFSATDDANENASQFYGVWGKVKDEQPAFAFRYCSGDSKIECDPSILFDWPTQIIETTHKITTTMDPVTTQTYVETEETIYHGPFDKINYPSEWMEQHTKAFRKSSPKDFYRTAPYSSYPSQQQAAYFEDEFYDPYIQETPYATHFTYSKKLTGMENAEVQMLLGDEKEAAADIEQEIDEITYEYVKAGYDTIIEEASDIASE